MPNSSMHQPSETTATHLDSLDLTRYQEFEIHYTPTQLQEIAAIYQLKISALSGAYRFNHEKLHRYLNNALLRAEDAEYLSAQLKEWPAQLTWSQWIEDMNALLMHWVIDYRAGTSLDVALTLAYCLELHHPNDQAGTQLCPQFHLFMAHLITKASHQFDQFRLNYIQHFDLETDLPNYQMLIDAVNTHFELDAEATQQYALILMNLNVDLDEESSLKTNAANISIAATQVIKRVLNENATVFRISHSMLAIYVGTIQFHAQLSLVASKLVNAFEYPLNLNHLTVILTPYFGCASTFNTRQNALSLYESAQSALQHAMIRHKQVELYDDQITSSIANMHLLDEAIIEALKQNELEIFLQPIITLPHETCLNAEVLLRWHSTEWTSISPMRIIDTIYRKGFGRFFIRWLINTACQKSAEINQQQNKTIVLTLNLSATDLLDADLPTLLSQAIDLWEVSASHLILELTESDILVDEKKSDLVIHSLVKLGFKLALDDFGTGYSSMARLRSMPVDFVKIDQSFVKNIAISKQDLEIVQSVIHLAHSLGKEVVAEGVESLECLETLKALKCEKIQGYYYAKPLPFDDFLSWVNVHNTQHQ